MMRRLSDVSIDAITWWTSRGLLLETFPLAIKVRAPVEGRHIKVPSLLASSDEL